MIDTHEPKDGDFIAYIEQLQKESAARLLASTQHLVTQLDKAPPDGVNKADHFFAGRKPADLRSAAQLQATLAQVVAVPSLVGLFASMLPILIGVLLALYWLMASASFVPLLIGIVLIVWGTRLFERARRRIAQRPNKETQALVSKVFAAPPAKTK
jgi:ABC-type multidrug transport system fused ATPase/permease subunit